MLTDAFCQQHRLFVSQEPSGQWCLNYQAPLLPWVYLYAVRLMPKPLNLREIRRGDFDAWLGQNALRDQEGAETADDKHSEHTFAGQLMLLQQGKIESKEALITITRLVNTMLQEARNAGASEIYIDIFQNHLQVSYRIDGLMQEIFRGDIRLGTLLMSHLKSMTHRDKGRRYFDQEGRFPHCKGEPEVDVRLQVMPVNDGERAVLHLPGPRQLPVAFSSLGMSETMGKYLNHVLHRRHGIVLVTGPAGSGKSSTLYTCLQQIKQSHRITVTTEGPVDNHMPGTEQTQINSRSNFDLTEGSRDIVRQETGVVVIDEICATKTASMAMQASLTGHLVLSTLHAHSAAGAVAHLCDMGIDPQLLASTLSALIAQRLVRKLCPHCREARPVNQQEQRWLKLDEDEARVTVIYDPAGCEKCNQQGYFGYVVFFELILLNTALRELIQQRASTEDLMRCARRSLAGIDDDARRKVLAGITSFAEAFRAIEEYEERG